MSGNPDPSPLTRFKPGQSGNPAGKPEGTLSRSTLMRSIPAVRSLEEVEADVRSWKGTMRQLFESIARDANNPLDIRMYAADKVKNFEEPKPKQYVNLDAISETERAELERIMSIVTNPKAPPLIDGGQRVLVGWSATGEPVIGPPPSPAEERDMLLAKLAQYLPAEKIAQLRNEWPE